MSKLYILTLAVSLISSAIIPVISHAKESSTSQQITAACKEQPQHPVCVERQTKKDAAHVRKELKQQQQLIEILKK